MSGQPPSSSIWWRWAASIFRWLLRLYPRRFREAYGSQMLQDFRDLWEEAARQRGAVGVCRVCWETLGDLVVTALAEQLRKELAMERRIVVRIGVALIWTTAVFEALRILSDNLPLPDRITGLRYWTYLLFNVMMLVGLVGLVVKYRQRMPRYIWLIGSVTTLAFFCWQLLPMLWNLGVYLVLGNIALDRMSINVWLHFAVFFPIYLVYTVGMLVWGISTLLKGILPRWVAGLLLLFGVDSLLQAPPHPDHISTIIGIGSGGIRSIVWGDLGLTYGTPYILVRCLLLAGLGYALWVHTRPGSVPSEPNAAGPAQQGFAEGVDPAV